MQHQTFNQWLPECEAELRTYTQYLFHKHKGWRLGIDSGDLFGDVVVKLAGQDHQIINKKKLFGLLSKSALNWMTDLGRKKSIRNKYFSLPMPTRARPLPGSSMETVAAKQPSPFEELALSDEIKAIRAAMSDPEIALLFQAITDLVGLGEPTTVANIGRHLKLPHKKVAKSLQRLRSVAKRIK